MVAWSCCWDYKRWTGHNMIWTYYLRRGDDGELSPTAPCHRPIRTSITEPRLAHAILQHYLLGAWKQWQYASGHSDSAEPWQWYDDQVSREITRCQSAGFILDAKTLNVWTAAIKRKLGWSHSFVDYPLTTCLEYSVTVATPASSSISFRAWLRKNVNGRAQASSGL
jgi:hypothetical protein